MNKLLLTALLGLAFTPAALAQTAQTQTTSTLTPQAALTRLAQASKVDAAWFTPAFVSTLPQIQGGFQGFKAQYGAFAGVDALGGDSFRLRYEGGSVTLSATLNPAGQFTGLFLKGQEANAAPAAPAPATPAPSTQSTPSPAPQTVAALTRLARASKVDAAWFTPAFASALPQIQSGFLGFAAQFGAFQGVDTLGGDSFRLRYERGTVTLTATLNPAGQFTGLFLKDQQASAAPAAKPSSTALTDEALTQQAALTRLFRAQTPNPEWFAPAFLGEVPARQLLPVLATSISGLGAFVAVDAQPDGSFVARFAQGSLPIKQVAVDAQGRFTALLLGAGVPNQKPNLGDAVKAFGALPGQNSVLVMENGKQVGALNPAVKLAVGSTFKLGILAELNAQIKAGRHQWAEVAVLQPGDKSLPSGILQTWPDAAPLTLQSLATLMISQSDNTAADVLLRVVGRGGVGTRLGLNVVPSTREAFALKNPANKAVLDAYLGGDDAQKKAALLQAAAAPLPPVSLFAPGAVLAPQAEWFVSAQTLCDLMNEVAALPLMQVTPGVADPALFKTVSFKGGSEGGVLNLTTQVTTNDGRTVCVSATSNDSKAIDEKAFASAYTRLLQAVR